MHVHNGVLVKRRYGYDSPCLYLFMLLIDHSEEVFDTR
jgi:hypothetical protein